MKKADLSSILIAVVLLHVEVIAEAQQPKKVTLRGPIGARPGYRVRRRGEGGDAYGHEVWKITRQSDGIVRRKLISLLGFDP
jgi:hypothetical protein